MGEDVWGYARFSSLLTLDYLLLMEIVQFPSRGTIKYNSLNDKLFGVKIHLLPDKVEFYFTVYSLREIVQV